MLVVGGLICYKHRAPTFACYVCYISKSENHLLTLADAATKISHTTQFYSEAYVMIDKQRVSLPGTIYHGTIYQVRNFSIYPCFFTFLFLCLVIEVSAFFTTRRGDLQEETCVSVPGVFFASDEFPGSRNTASLSSGKSGKTLSRE